MLTEKSSAVKVAVMSDSLQPHGLYSPWNSPGQDPGVGGPFPSPGDLPNPGVEPRSPTLQADSLPAEPQGSLLAERGCFILPSVTSSRQDLSWSVSWWRWRQHLRGITHQGLGERFELRPRLLRLQAPPG